MDKENLVFVVIDDVRERSSAADQIRLRKLALKHRVLQVIPAPPHRLEDLAKALIIGNVVANQIGLPHTEVVYLIFGPNKCGGCGDSIRGYLRLARGVTSPKNNTTVSLNCDSVASSSRPMRLPTLVLRTVVTLSVGIYPAMMYPATRSPF
jgi:hypothetical protein